MGKMCKYVLSLLWITYTVFYPAQVNDQDEGVFVNVTTNLFLLSLWTALYIQYTTAIALAQYRGALTERRQMIHRQPVSG